MRCHTCGHENADGNSFCVHCGSPLAAPDGATLESLQASVLRLSAEVADMRRIMAAHGLTGQPGAGRARPRPPAAEPRAPVMADDAPSGGPAAEAADDAPSGEPAAAGTVRRRGIASSVDWEIVLGGNWLARVGALALIIGVAFFLKLAFDNDWIGETGRIALGIAGGLALVGAGEYWYRRYAIYAQALIGGGVAILYLSVFAAYAFYDLVAVYPAIGALAFISVGAAALALRHESTSLAILGIVGAFLAPFLIGETGAPAETSAAGASYEVMAYVVVINLGVLALSTFRNWRWFTLLSLIASLASFMAWLDYQGPDIEIAASQAFLTAIFLTFVASTMLYHVLWRRVPRAFDHAIMTLNAGAYLALSYAMMWDDFREWMGLFAFSLALFYVGLGALALRRGREQYYLALMALGVAMVMLAVAAPVQFGGPWFGAAWTAQGAVLVWLSFRLGRLPTRIAGYVQLGLAASWLLLADMPQAISEDLTPFWNPYALTFAVAAAAAYAAAYMLRRERGTLHERERVAFPAVLTGANVLLVALFATQLGSPWLPIAWSALALGMLWLSLAWGLREMRWFACALLAVVALRLVGAETDIDTDDFTAILNGRMLAFASGIAALYAACAMLRGRQDDATEQERRFLVPAMLVGASFLTLWILGAEAFAIVDSGIIELSEEAAFYAKSLALSLVVAVYASVALAVGVLRRLRTVRVASLALLALPVVKLFLVDSFALEQGYRVAAFLCLGALLLAGGFLYQRYQEAIREFLFEARDAR